MEEMELICFQMISTVGTAKSLYIESIGLAKQGKYDDALEKIKEGDEAFIEGHHVHADLIAKEANGEKIEVQLLLMHAEDQLMSAESFKTIAMEFIDVYKKIGE
jgi:Phosphotransferase system cellobiose-specific component IIA